MEIQKILLLLFLGEGYPNDPTLLAYGLPYFCYNTQNIICRISLM